jgi:4-nitrophenyl phosphatase
MSAVRVFQQWYEAGIQYAFVTNNSTKSPKAFSEKLSGMGIPTRASQVVTSAQEAAEKAANELPKGSSVYVIGSNALCEELEKQGFVISYKNAEAVVVGLDRRFDFEKLQKAQSAILGGALFIGTNPDPMLPSETGFEPGAGAILKAIETAAAIAPTIVGKPKPNMVKSAVGILQTNPENTLMVGDQIKTDIVAGDAAGLKTVLVKTGVPERGVFEVTPDIVIETLEELRLRV